MNIFVDLEETVIDEFGKTPAILLGGCRVVRSTIQSFSAENPKVFIFSFAIHTPEEVEEFNTFILPDLLHHLNIQKIDGVVTVPQMMSAGGHRDVTDFIIDCGKAKAFDEWCMKHHPGQINILLDDVVRNRTTVDHATGTTIHTIKVEAR